MPVTSPKDMLPNTEFVFVFRASAFRPRSPSVTVLLAADGQKSTCALRGVQQRTTAKFTPPESFESTLYGWYNLW